MRTAAEALSDDSRVSAPGGVMQHTDFEEAAHTAIVDATRALAYGEISKERFFKIVFAQAALSPAERNAYAVGALASYLEYLSLLRKIGL